MAKGDRGTGGAREDSRSIGKVGTSGEGNRGSERNVDLAICWCRHGELASILHGLAKDDPWIYALCVNVGAPVEQELIMSSIHALYV